jgi:hypothetical protein
MLIIWIFLPRGHDSRPSTIFWGTKMYLLFVMPLSPDMLSYTPMLAPWEAHECCARRFWCLVRSKSFQQQENEWLAQVLPAQVGWNKWFHQRLQSPHWPRPYISCERASYINNSITPTVLIVEYSWLQEAQQRILPNLALAYAYADGYKTYFQERTVAPAEKSSSW